MPNIERGRPFEIEVDGRRVVAYEGETLATVLLGAGIRAFHHDSHGGACSRFYCGMGVCMQCLTTVDGIMNCQACRTLARPGMKVETER